MAKDNAQIQRDKGAKEKALIDRIGAAPGFTSPLKNITLL
jgi:hypothetical protein